MKRESKKQSSLPNQHFSHSLPTQPQPTQPTTTTGIQPRSLHRYYGRFSQYSNKTCCLCPLKKPSQYWERVCGVCCFDYYSNKSKRNKGYEMIKEGRGGEGLSSNSYFIFFYCFLFLDAYETAATFAAVLSNQNFRHELAEASTVEATRFFLPSLLFPSLSPSFKKAISHTQKKKKKNHTS